VSDLLDAVRQRRGEDTTLADEAAGKILSDEVPKIVQATLRVRFGSELRQNLADDVAAEALEKAWGGLCTSNEIAQVVTFFQTVALHDYLDSLRRESREEPTATDDEGGQGSRKLANATTHSAAPDQTLAAREDLTFLHTLRSKILLMAGKKQKRVRAFLDRRLQLDGEDEHLECPTTKEEKLARDRVYQDRYMGRKYAIDIVDSLRMAGQLSDDEILLATRILSDPELRSVPEEDNGDVQP
jgi:DNA-directed RNA polymerase specialized sigma24 family protein